MPRYLPAIALIAAPVALAACMGSTGAPPVASSGYATATSDFINTDGETFTVGTPLQRFDAAGTASQVEETVVLESDGTMDHFFLTYDGVTIQMDQDPANDDEYWGADGTGLEIEFDNLGESDNGQLYISYITVTDTRAGANETTEGYLLAGFNSDPDVVGARAGMATYVGGGAVFATRESGAFTYGSEEGTITVDFDTARFTGSFTAEEHGDSTPGYELTLPTLVGLEGKVEGNMLTGTATFDAADWGFTSTTDAALDAMFYEADATAIGGNIVGTAVDNSTGETVFLNGIVFMDE